MPKLLAMLAALVAGSMIAFQAPVNARLGSIMGGPLVATFFSFAVGTAALALLLVATGQMPAFSKIGATAPWMWIGGLLGAVLVFTSISVVPILGAALMIALFVTGQLIAGLIIDKTGFLLPEAVAIGWERILALLLIIAGVALFSLSRGDG